jgi:predicted amidophosphoribosyltransferase
VTVAADIPSADPPAHPCASCDRATRSTGALCFCCRQAAACLGLPLVPSTALVEYRLGDRIHRLLRGYKDGAAAGHRAACEAALVELVAARWAGTADGIADRLGPWTAVAAVPSSRRPGPAPALRLFAGVPALSGLAQIVLARSSARCGHLRADRRAFAVAPGPTRAALAVHRVLVVDDTVTTGAAAQSAAAALRLAGASVAGVVAVGRALPRALPHTGGPASGGGGRAVVGQI